MGYVSAAQQSGLVISATKGLWIYAIITVPLIVITMGVYLILEFVNRKLQGKKHASQQITLDIV